MLLPCAPRMRGNGLFAARMEILLQRLLADPVQLGPRQRGEYFPAEIQGLVYASILPFPLGQELPFEAIAEAEITFVQIGQLLLPDDCRERPDALHPRVAGE